MLNFRNPLSHLTWASKSITTQNGALNPILWLCGICVPSAVVCAIFAPSEWMVYMFFALLTPVAVALACYVGLLMMAPDRLHSERHQIELRKLATIGDDRSGGVVLEHEPTTNPSSKRLS